MSDTTDSAVNEARRRRRTRRPIAETSRQAYLSAKAQRQKVYAAIRELFEINGPMTGDQLVHAYNVSGKYENRTPQCVLTARREMADAGLVRETGEKGLSDFGNPSKIWELTPTNHDGTASV